MLFGRPPDAVAPVYVDVDPRNQELDDDLDPLDPEDVESYTSFLPTAYQRPHLKVLSYPCTCRIFNRTSTVVGLPLAVVSARHL